MAPLSVEVYASRSNERCDFDVVQILQKSEPVELSCLIIKMANETTGSDAKPVTLLFIAIARLY